MNSSVIPTHPKVPNPAIPRIFRPPPKVAFVPGRDRRPFLLRWNPTISEGNNFITHCSLFLYLKSSFA